MVVVPNLVPTSVPFFIPIVFPVTVHSLIHGGYVKRHYQGPVIYAYNLRAESPPTGEAEKLFITRIGVFYSAVSSESVKEQLGWRGWCTR